MSIAYLPVDLYSILKMLNRLLILREYTLLHDSGGERERENIPHPLKGESTMTNLPLPEQLMKTADLTPQTHSDPHLHSTHTTLGDLHTLMFHQDSSHYASNTNST